MTGRELTESEKKRAKYTPEGPLVCSDEVQCLASYISSAYTLVKEYEIELQYLKSKVDAGASLITTQMFFEAELYQQFVEDCKARGINAVVIPGIMLLQVCDLMIGRKHHRTHVLQDIPRLPPHDRDVQEPRARVACGPAGRCQGRIVPYAMLVLNHCI